MVPRRDLGGAGLLDQHMLVEDAHAAGLHESPGYGRCRTVADEGAVLVDALPVAIVLEEIAAPLGGTMVAGQCAGLGNVLLHTAL